MKGLLLPLCCLVVLGPQLRGALADGTTGNQSTTVGGSSNSAAVFTPRPPSPAPITVPTTTSATTTTTKTTTTSSTPVTQGPFDFLSTPECRPVTLVAGGLVLACAILLVSTLMLACRVCHLSRRLRTLSSSLDQVSSTENCTVTSKQAASTAGARETTVLLSDLGRTQEDLANGTPKEEEEGGRAKEEEKKKAEGGGADGEEAATGEEKKEEAPVAAASQPKEDVTGSRSDVAAASSSEGAGEPKDVV